MFRARANIVSSVVAALVLAAPAVAAAPTTVAVDAHFEDPGFLTGAKGADCPLDPMSICEGQFHGHSDTTGSMTGHSEYDIWGTFNPLDQKLHFHARETFTGTVTGCGKGAFDFTLAGYADAGPTGTQIHGTWKFVSGSGTGGLRGIKSGSGTEDGTAGPNAGAGSPDPSSNSGTFAGSLSCKPH
jgi:Protein of unknown function (DUF3224)